VQGISQPGIEPTAPPSHDDVEPVAHETRDRIIT
jgi:hypothetical protein